MRAYAQIRAGRVVALALRVWLRRSLQIHAVAALCLAPLVVVPELLGASRILHTEPPFRDGTLGLFGLFATAWTVSADLHDPHDGLFRNLMVVYFAQFAVSVLLVRDAHRHLSGRAPRCGLLAFLGLGSLAVGCLTVFVALDSLAAASFGSPSALPLLLVIATTIAELYLAGAYWLAVPAAAVDGYGVLSAFGRSWRLSEGSRDSVASLVVMIVVLQVFAVVVTIILADAFGLRRRADWLILVPAGLFLTLKSCLLAAAYHEACFRKEGAGTEEVSAVFA